MVDYQLGIAYSNGADRKEDKFVVVRLRAEEGIVDWEQVIYAAQLLGAAIPTDLLKTYAEKYCEKLNLFLRSELPSAPDRRAFGWAYNTETLDYLRGPHIVSRLQLLLHVKVPESPPPHMIRILESTCIWLLERMRVSKAHRDDAALAGYTVALMLAPKLLLPLNAEDLFGYKREALFLKGDFEQLFIMAEGLKSRIPARFNVSAKRIFNGDPDNVDYGISTASTNVNNIIASRYLGDYQPSQALKCLMQAPPPPSTPQVREQYMRHVIKYTDSHLVKTLNETIHKAWRRASRAQRIGMLEDFESSQANPSTANQQLESLLQKWGGQQLREALGPPRGPGGRHMGLADLIANEDVLHSDDPPPHIVVPPSFRPTPQVTYTKEECPKDKAFWRKLIKEQPRRSSGGPTGWRFSLLQGIIETAIEIMQE